MLNQVLQEYTAAGLLWFLLLLAVNDVMGRSCGGHQNGQREDLEEGDKRRDKWVRFFNLLDADNDGVVDRHEYINGSVERAMGYFAPEKINAFNETVSRAWSSFWSTPEDDFQQCFDVLDFISAHAAVFNTTMFQPSVKYWAKGLFRAADEDDDEELNVFEHKAFLQASNVHKGFYKSFSFVDENQSRSIDKKEFVTAAVDYFCNRYDGSLFYGE
ncbi:sarcoplasmic calcium-binding protein-like [Lingula anatina]|uniref:Sarcoplasmic calcium-binding protein-like n=1 Tax=Lingula anatina TaxID=7574 RepID=A0A1S3IY40_LINAN|nr:sarcoplasmic calcium-binding protein-like [Lingula anatina]|eukprot:XP_013402464.1 sarcoplasmic calcium-binding protein-like [Lingula anatina]